MDSAVNVRMDGLWVLWTAAECFLSLLHDAFDGRDMIPTRSLPKGHHPVTLLAKCARKVVGREVLVRPLAGRSGWCLVPESRGETRNSYGDAWQASIRLNDTFDGIDVIEGTLPADLLDAIMGLVKDLAGIAGASMVGEFMQRTVRNMGGVGLRPGKGAGGVYWVPQANADAFKDFADTIGTCAVRSGSLRVYPMQFVVDAPAIECLTDGFTADLEKEAREIQAEVDKGLAKQRALDARVEDCGVLLARVEQYEQTLARQLPTLRDLVERTRQSAMIASIASAAKAQAEAEAGTPTFSAGSPIADLFE